MRQTVRLLSLSSILVASFTSATIFAKPSFSDQKDAWGADLEVSPGFGAIATSAAIESVALLGGQARLRLWSVQFGGFTEFGSLQTNSARTSGGFVGLWLTPQNSADFDLALALGRREYTHDDPDGTARDYTFSNAVLGARAGLSDRLGGLFGARVGVRLALWWDVQRHVRTWSYEKRDLPTIRVGDNPEPTNGTDPVTVTGARGVGGFTVALLLTVGLDVTP